MKILDVLTESIYGKYEIVEDPDMPQWLIKTNGTVVQQFPYNYRDDEDKTQELKNAIRWTQTNKK